MSYYVKHIIHAQKRIMFGTIYDTFNFNDSKKRIDLISETILCTIDNLIMYMK